MIFAGSRSGGRIAAFGILGLLLVVFWLGPVSLYLDMVGGGGEQLLQRAALLQRYQALSQAPASTAAPTTETHTAVAGGAVFFPDIPEAQAVVMLQEAVRSAAAANRIQIHSLQVLRNDAVADAVRMAVRIRAAGDVQGIGRLLYAIESARPVLYPDNLQIQAPPAVPGAAASPLDFQLDVSGFHTAGAS
ncbi:MAG TPA: type II secretion system protein GspM [Stellaceae bacterium]|jgi:general secretion pathway protein M|nr:type II secretion system protein GspM [Stellaceae bacterium]